MNTPPGASEWLEEMSRALNISPTNGQEDAAMFPTGLKDDVLNPPATRPKPETTGCPPWPFPPKEKSAEDKIMELLEKLQNKESWLDEPLPAMDPRGLLDDVDPWCVEPPWDPGYDCEPPVFDGAVPYEPSIMENYSSLDGEIVYNFLPHTSPDAEPVSPPAEVPWDTWQQLKENLQAAAANPDAHRVELPPEYYEVPIQYIAPGGAPSNEPAANLPPLGLELPDFELPDIELPDIELPEFPVYGDQPYGIDPNDIDLPSLDEVKKLGSEVWNIGSNSASILGETLGPVGTAVDVIGAGLGIYKIGSGMVDGFDDDDIVDSEGNTTGEGFTGDDYLDIAEGNTDILASVGGIFGGPVGWAGSAGYAVGNLITSYAIDPYLNRPHTEDAADYGKGFDPESGKPYNPADDHVWWHDEQIEGIKNAYEDMANRAEEGYEYLDDKYEYLNDKYEYLDDKVNEFGDDVDEYLNEQFDAADEYIDKKVEAAEEYVDKKVEDAKEAIGDAADSAKDYASEKASEAMDLLDDLNPF